MYRPCGDDYRVGGLLTLLGPLGLPIGILLGIIATVWLYERMKAQAAERNYRRALARERGEEEAPWEA